LGGWYQREWGGYKERVNVVEMLYTYVCKHHNVPQYNNLKFFNSKTEDCKCRCYMLFSTRSFKNLETQAAVPLSSTWKYAVVTGWHELNYSSPGAGRKD
jgi:hypothetical protein